MTDHDFQPETTLTPTTWKGKRPVVSLVVTVYATGVKLTPEETRVLEAEVIRVPSLEKWFVKIPRRRGRPPKN